MAVSLNANNSAHVYDVTLGATQDHTGLTIAAGSNIALIVLIAWSDQTHTYTVDWDATGTPQALTSVGTVNAGAGGLGRCDIWQLLNPTTGNRTLRANIASGFAGEIFWNAAAFDGVASFGTFTTATGNSNSASTSITSASGDMTVCVASGPEVFGAITQTPLFEDDTSGSFTSAAATRSTGTANPTQAFPLNSAVEWVVAGVNLVQVGGGSGGFRILNRGLRPRPFAPGLAR